MGTGYYEGVILGALMMGALIGLIPGIIGYKKGKIGLARGCKIKCVSLRRESSKLTHFVSFTECDKITGKD